MVTEYERNAEIARRERALKQGQTVYFGQTLASMGRDGLYEVIHDMRAELDRLYAAETKGWSSNGLG